MCLLQNQPQKFRKMKKQGQCYISTILVGQSHISKALMTYFYFSKLEKEVMDPLFQDNCTLNWYKIVPNLFEENYDDIPHHTWNATSQSLNVIGKFWDLFIRKASIERNILKKTKKN